MKKIYQLLLFVGLLSPWAVVQADELHLYADATSSDQYVPFYGYYADAAQHNQLIYPASELGAMSGKFITQMVFYIDQTESNGYNTSASQLGTWTVSLGETESATLSGLDNSTPLTQVYQGYFDCSTGTLTLEFEAGYAYKGGNLLIDLDHAAAGYNKWFFLGVSASGASYTYNGQRNFLPRVTFSYEIPSSCAKPSGLSASNVLHNEATIGWTENGSATAWEICINDDEANAIEVRDNPYRLKSLSPSTSYSIKVRANCGSEYSAWTNAINFKTTAVAEAVGDEWIEDFEGAFGWELINGTLTNAWAHGSATSSGGTQSLYISNNGGTSNAYTNTSPAMVYATRLLQFANSKYEFSYDWNGKGEGSYDYMRVALVPSSVELAAGTSAPSGFGTNILPSGWIALDGGNKLNDVTSWQNKNVAINVPAGNYYLVFAWLNDNSTGTNPPAAVDNIHITKVACPYDAENISVDGESISTNSATINWDNNTEVTGWQVAYSLNNAFPEAETELSDADVNTIDLKSLVSSSTYYVRIRAYCGGSDYGSWSAPISFTTACEKVSVYPWNENFDGITSVSGVLPNCWARINTSTSSTYKVYPYVYANSTYTIYAHSGSNCLYFYVYSSAEDQYAVLPEMDLSNKRIVFWAKRSTYGVGQLKVGEITDPSDPSKFELLENGDIALTSAYQKYTLTLAGKGSHIAFLAPKGSSSSTNYAYIDDITVEEIPSCLEPSDLAVVSTTTSSASFSWTEGGGEREWDIYYSTENVAPTAESTPSISGTSEKEIPSGLNASTLYYLWVRSRCSDSEFSPWVGGIKFQTACAPINASSGWIENFDSYSGVTSTSAPVNYPNDELPICWQFLNRSDNSSNYPQVFISSTSGYAVSGNSLFFKSSATTPIYAILPEFEEEISTLQLTFSYRNESTGNSNGILYAGYMTDPADAATFETVLTCPQVTSLTEKEVFFGSAPSGSYIAFKYEGGTSNNYYLSIDNVEVTAAPSCLKPSTPVCESKTAHAATLSWTNGGSESAWDISYSTESTFNPEDGMIANVASNPCVLEGLAQNTTYYAYVRANCGAVDGVSAWSKTSVSFTTLAGNQTPVNLAVDGSTLSAESATLTWGRPSTNELHESYDLYYSTESEFPLEPSGAGLIEGIAIGAYTLNGLNAETQYYVWVRDNCGADGYSAWTSSLSFTTLANCPIPGTLHAENVGARSADISWEIGTNDRYNLRYRTPAEFDAALDEKFGTSIPSGWSIYTGQFNETDGTATLTSVTYGWSFGSSNGAFDAHAYTNIYGDNKRWLVTPQITLNSDLLSFDVAYTKYSGTLQTPDQNGSDDKFIVLISEDKAKWDVLRKWDNAGSAFVLNDIAHTAEGEEAILDISAYKGKMVYIAFYAESTTSNADNNLHIDNVKIGSEIPAGDWNILNGDNSSKSMVINGLTPETKYEVQIQGVCGDEPTVWNESEALQFKTAPSCLAPSALAANDITANSASLSWTENNGAMSWQICINGDEEHPINVSENPYILSELNTASNYTIKVRSICGIDDYSSWSDACAFATLCNTIVVDAEHPFNEGFESAALPNCWDNIEFNVYKWAVSTSSSVHSGDRSIHSGYYGPIYLVTPELSIANDAKKDVKLSFWSYTNYASYYDKHSVVLYSGSETELWTVESIDAEDETWVEHTVELNLYKGQTIRLAFKFEGNNADDWYIDDVKIEFTDKSPGTGIDAVNGEKNAVKFIKNDHLYIRLNGVVYDVTGRVIEK